MARPHLMPSVQPSERLVGEAPAIAALRVQIHHLVTFDTPGNPVVPTVLLQGETGTGKGLLARDHSRDRPTGAGAFPRGELRGDPRGIAGGGAVWLRGRRLHRRQTGETSPVGSGVGGHTVPG